MIAKLQETPTRGASNTIQHLINWNGGDTQSGYVPQILGRIRFCKWHFRATVPHFRQFLSMSQDLGNVSKQQSPHLAQKNDKHISIPKITNPYAISACLIAILINIVRSTIYKEFISDEQCLVYIICHFPARPYQASLKIFHICFSATMLIASVQINRFPDEWNFIELVAES